MPNWCENRVLFTSTRKSDIERLRKRAKDKFDFNRFIPYPYRFKCLDKLSEMRGVKLKKEAEKRGYENFWELPETVKKKIEEKSPFILNGYNQGGHEWCLKNWGTKWNACNVSFDEEIKTKGKIYLWSVVFDTAWSPPIPIFENIAERYPKINITAFFEEEGNGIEGTFEYKDGITDFSTKN